MSGFSCCLEFPSSFGFCSILLGSCVVNLISGLWPFRRLISRKASASAHGLYAPERRDMRTVFAECLAVMAGVGPRCVYVLHRSVPTNADAFKLSSVYETKWNARRWKIPNAHCINAAPWLCGLPSCSELDVALRPFA